MATYWKVASSPSTEGLTATTFPMTGTISEAIPDFLPFWENPPDPFSWESGAVPMAKTIHSERDRAFRELLKARRKAAGLTQTVVAQRLGKPPSYVAKYE